MNRQLSIEEVDAMFSTIIDNPVMTRKEKLMHWAKLVRQHRSYLYIFHRLEDWNAEQLAKAYHHDSAFTLASRDPAFKAAGLKSGYVGEAMKFFELSQQQLHEFSCDCGGEIRASSMADRIERLAG